MILVSAAAILKKIGKQTADTSYSASTVEKTSEPTTVKLNYTGLSKFEYDVIPFINKWNFSMLYKTTARVGTDVKK